MARASLRALASRAEFEAFSSRACSHVRALERGIDRAYGRLERGQDCARIIEGMETEREEILLRVDEALAMIEDQCDDEGDIEVDGVEEDSNEPRAPWLEDQRWEKQPWNREQMRAAEGSPRVFGCA